MRNADAEDDITPSMDQFVTRTAMINDDEEGNQLVNDVNATLMAEAAAIFNPRKGKVLVPGRGEVYVETILAEHSSTQSGALSSDRLLRVQQANKACGNSYDLNKPVVTLGCDIGVLFDNDWFVGTVERMFYLQGKKKVLCTAPVDFQTMNEKFHVVCNFFRRVNQDDPTLYYPLKYWQSLTCNCNQRLAITS